MASGRILRAGCLAGGYAATRGRHRVRLVEFQLSAEGERAGFTGTERVRNARQEIRRQVTIPIVNQGHVAERDGAAVAHRDAVAERRQVRAGGGHDFEAGGGFSKYTAQVGVNQTRDFLGHADLRRTRSDCHCGAALARTAVTRDVVG